MSPSDAAWRLLKAYDVEDVKRMRMNQGDFEDYIDHQIANAQPGMNRKLPRPYGLMSHEALNLLHNGFYEGDIREMLDDPNFAFHRAEDGQIVWNAHNLGAGEPEYAHPEHMGFMIENQLEGTPIDFEEIGREISLRELENTPWELPEPQTSKFLGLELKPTSTTDFSTIYSYGPTDTLEQVEGRKGRGFQDIMTGEPMDLSWRLLKNIDEVQLCPSCQGVGFGCRYCKGTGLADNERFHPEDTTNEYPGYDEDWPYPTDKKIGQTVPDAQKTDDGKPITFFHNTEDWLASRPEPIKMRTNSQDQPSFMYMPFAGASKEMKNPAAKIFRRSEPMNLVWRLLKEEDDEVPDPRKFKMPQEDYVEALRERAKRIKGRQADPNMAENTENVPMGLKEKVPFTQPPGGGPIQLPTKLTPPNASQGIQRRVHPFTREGTFEGLPLDTPDADPKKYFTRSEAMDIAYQLLKFEELTDMHAPAPRNFNEYFGIKDSWVSLPKEGMDARPQLYDEVANAMNIAYKPVGGHDKYSDGNDLKNESKHARYDMIDNDQDPYVDAARVFSQQEQGFKASITAHDGQPAAKRAAVDHMMEHMQIPGHYIEVSGAWPRIFDKQGMQPITDYDHIRELVNRPLRETETAPGTYTRKIGENEREKQIFGSPMRDGATWADDFMQQATEASRNNSALVLNDYNFPKSVGVM